uniref:BPTI/Kunitz inhibitor domain-containing protein n=1 Tax=Nothoprocta perdicaria TaxID=30464 RepID=A0A8C6Z8B9_NOTPE
MDGAAFGMGCRMVLELQLAWVSGSSSGLTKGPGKSQSGSVSDGYVCVLAASCLQPMDEGSCQRYVLLWYYHPEADACRPFVFGGCRGNGNRFETKWKCEQQCKMHLQKGSASLIYF